MKNVLILVTEKDKITGFGDKTEVHRRGLLHRAFSILVFNAKNELLLQKRAPGKYHSGGLWTNTCCSHPTREEDMLAAAHRRLKEEMGFDCGLDFAFKFLYKAPLDHGLIEHELDHVFTGQYDGPVYPDPLEAFEFRWVSLDVIKEDIHQNPDTYTVWFKLILDHGLL